MLRTQAWQQCNAFLGDQTSKFTFCISITCFVFVEHNIFIRFIERISPCFAQLFAAASKLNAFFGCVFIENTAQALVCKSFQKRDRSRTQMEGKFSPNIGNQATRNPGEHRPCHGFRRHLDEQANA